MFSEPQLLDEVCQRFQLAAPQLRAPSSVMIEAPSLNAMIATANSTG